MNFPTSSLMIMLTRISSLKLIIQILLPLKMLTLLTWKLKHTSMIQILTLAFISPILMRLMAMTEELGIKVKGCQKRRKARQIIGRLLLQSKRETWVRSMFLDRKKDKPSQRGKWDQPALVNFNVQKKLTKPRELWSLKITGHSEVLRSSDTSFLITWKLYIQNTDMCAHGKWLKKMVQRLQKLQEDAMKLFFSSWIQRQKSVFASCFSKTHSASLTEPLVLLCQNV